MFEYAKPFLLSLALGLLIGIERERALAADHADASTGLSAGKVALGARTFALLALLGCMAAYVASPAVAAVVAVAAGAIVLASYIKTPGPDGLGATTEVAALATFVLGYLAQGAPRLTPMLGVLVVSVLAHAPSAVLAILIAFATNMLVKLGIVSWAGGRRLAFYAAPPMVAMAVAAVVAFSLMRV